MAMTAKKLNGVPFYPGTNVMSLQIRSHF